MKNLVIKTNILNPVSTSRIDYSRNKFIEIHDNKILNITDTHDGTFLDKTDFLCIPGFIDTHVHLSQYNIRGSHSPNLLHWLNTYTFAEENKSRKPQYAEEIARKFFSDQLMAGTTTSVIYTAPFFTACDKAFQVAEELGLRSIIGMTMMDQNSPDYLLQKTNDSLRDSFFLFDKWNKTNPLLEYVLTPRFAPTCSAKLMEKTGAFARDNDAYIQTHLSENIDEINWVKELYPECSTYTEVYNKFNILGSKTLLGHVIHLEDEEIQLLKESDSKVIHCPDSNFFIKSGMFPLEKLKKAGIKLALASDVAGGTTLSMPFIMKMFAYRQNTYLVSPQEAFYFATLGGAVVLSKEHTIGSLDINKEADIVFLSLPDLASKDVDRILSDILYLNHLISIESTYIAGKKVYQA